MVGLQRAECFVEKLDGDDEASLCSARRHYEQISPAPLPNPSPPQKYPKDQVLINVYEIAGITSFSYINRLMADKRFPVGAALHAGVQVYGREWSYGGGERPGYGVVCGMPRGAKHYNFRDTIVMPQTKLSDGEVAQVIGEMLEAWSPQDYHWLHRNCLSFANEFCERIGVGRLPAWVDRLARGAGAVDNGVKAVVQGVQEAASGATGAFFELISGPGSCRGAGDVQQSFVQCEDSTGRDDPEPQFGFDDSPLESRPHASPRWAPSVPVDRSRLETIS